MDHDVEFGKIKWLIVPGVFFLAPGYASYQELTYAVWGRTAEATITDAFETTGGRHSRSQLVLKYAFTTEDGAHRTGDDYVAIDWPVPPDGQMSVQYLPGSERSRVDGTRNWVAVAFFFASLAWLAFSFFKLYREAQDHGPIASGDVSAPTIR